MILTGNTFGNSMIPNGNTGMQARTYLYSFTEVATQLLPLYRTITGNLRTTGNETQLSALAALLRGNHKHILLEGVNYYLFFLHFPDRQDSCFNDGIGVTPVSTAVIIIKDCHCCFFFVGTPQTGARYFKNSWYRIITF